MSDEREVKLLGLVAEGLTVCDQIIRNVDEMFDRWDKYTEEEKCVIKFHAYLNLIAGAAFVGCEMTIDELMLCIKTCPVATEAFKQRSAVPTAKA